MQWEANYQGTDYFGLKHDGKFIAFTWTIDDKFYWTAFGESTADNPFKTLAECKADCEEFCKRQIAKQNAVWEWKEHEEGHAIHNLFCNGKQVAVIREVLSGWKLCVFYYQVKDYHTYVNLEACKAECKRQAENFLFSPFGSGLQ